MRIKVQYDSKNQCKAVKNQIPSPLNNNSLRVPLLLAQNHNFLVHGYRTNIVMQNNSQIISHCIQMNQFLYESRNPHTNFWKRFQTSNFITIHIAICQDLHNSSAQISMNAFKNMPFITTKAYINCHWNCHWMSLKIMILWSKKCSSKLLHQTKSVFFSLNRSAW